MQHSKRDKCKKLYLIKALGQKWCTLVHDRENNVIAKSCTLGTTKVVFFQLRTSIERGSRHAVEFIGWVGESQDRGRSHSQFHICLTKIQVKARIDLSISLAKAYPFPRGHFI